MHSIKNLLNYNTIKKMNENEELEFVLIKNSKINEKFDTAHHSYSNCYNEFHFSKQNRVTVAIVTNVKLEKDCLKFYYKLTKSIGVVASIMWQVKSCERINYEIRSNPLYYLYGLRSLNIYTSSGKCVIFPRIFSRKIDSDTMLKKVYSVYSNFIIPISRSELSLPKNPIVPHKHKSIKVFETIPLAIRKNKKVWKWILQNREKYSNVKKPSNIKNKNVYFCLPVNVSKEFGEILNIECALISSRTLLGKILTEIRNEFLKSKKWSNFIENPLLEFFELRNFDIYTNDNNSCIIFPSMFYKVYRTDEEIDSLFELLKIISKVSEGMINTKPIALISSNSNEEEAMTIRDIWNNPLIEIIKKYVKDLVFEKPTKREFIKYYWKTAKLIAHILHQVIRTGTSGVSWIGIIVRVLDPTYLPLFIKVMLHGAENYGMIYTAIRRLAKLMKPLIKITKNVSRSGLLVKFIGKKFASKILRQLETLELLLILIIKRKLRVIIGGILLGETDPKKQKAIRKVMKRFTPNKPKKLIRLRKRQF